MQKGFHAVEVLQKGSHAVEVLQKGLLAYYFDHRLWLFFPGVVQHALERGGSQATDSQSARSRSPRHGLVSLHGLQEPQQLQGAVAPALGVDPALGSSEKTFLLTSPASIERSVGRVLLDQHTVCPEAPYFG